jgi:putative membrane protein
MMPSVGLLFAALVALGAYGWGGRRATRWPLRRGVAFGIGVLVVLFALSPAVDAWSDERLSLHMAQHLALTLVAAPLLVLGAPVALALRALPHGGRRVLVGVIRSRPARVLTHPLVTWTLFAAVMLGTHLTGLYELALRHPAVHAAEHVAFLASAVLFWLPVLGAEPIPHRPGWTGRMLYLMTAMPAMAFAGVVLSIEDHVRYASYLAPARRLGISALADQHAAGTMMWVGGSAITAVLTLVTAWSALIQEERRALAREAYLDGAR